MCDIFAYTFSYIPDSTIGLNITITSGCLLIVDETIEETVCENKEISVAEYATIQMDDDAEFEVKVIFNPPNEGVYLLNGWNSEI